MPDESSRADWDYPTALRAIWNRSGYDRGYISNPFRGDEAARLGLRRTAALLDRLGRPQERYGIVHVAGSKGKGSVCAILDAILTAAGYRTGRYTSPHLHAFRERVAVGGEPVDEATFAGLTRRAVDAAVDLEREAPELGAVTAFELTTAMALDAFAAAGCDVAIVEVGLGGTLDATNVVDPLVAVITALDLEHTAVLGTSLPEIARQKAGIIKPGKPVAVSPQPADALAVIERAARERGSRLLVGGRDWTWSGNWRRFEVSGPWGTMHDLRLGLVGRHQVENACTGLAAAWLLHEAGWSTPADALRTGLASARWPGRFERVSHPTGIAVVLDGAHTPASASALAASLIEEETDRRAVVVLGMMGDKDPAAVAMALAPVTDRFVVTAASTPRAAHPERVATGAATTGRPVAIVPGVAAALAAAVDGGGSTGLVVVTGSLTVVAEAREALGLATHDPPIAGVP
jgi:dihydrofolate synthase/folylpolyglutamate synthase